MTACRNKTYARRGLFLREIDARNGANIEVTEVNVEGDAIDFLQTRVATRSYEDICGAEYRVLVGFWTDYAQCMRCFKSTVSPVSAEDSIHIRPEFIKGNFHLTLLLDLVLVRRSSLYRRSRTPRV